MQAVRRGGGLQSPTARGTLLGTSGTSTGLVPKTDRGGGQEPHLHVLREDVLGAYPGPGSAALRLHPTPTPGTCSPCGPAQASLCLFTPAWDTT